MDECVYCGCTDMQACADPFNDGEPCFWIFRGICSACRHHPIGISAPQAGELEPNYLGLALTPHGRLVPLSDYLNR